MREIGFVGQGVIGRPVAQYLPQGGQTMHARAGAFEHLFSISLDDAHAG
jgi:hypothetical protein